MPLQRAELPLLAQQGPSSSLPEVEGWRVHRCHGEQVRLQASSGQVSCASQISISTCRHYYLERDARPTVTQRMALAEMSESTNFSSPYQVKICKEKLVHRREEMDIETGKRRSWVEEEEREVYDLTGDTPVKPLPMPKRKLQAQSVQGSKSVGSSPPPALSPSPMRPSSRPFRSNQRVPTPFRPNAIMPPRNSPPTQASCHK